MAGSWLLGAIAATALPPLCFLPGLLSFAGLLVLLRCARTRVGAFATAWAFGFGWFLAGLYWIAIAFQVDAERFGALGIPAVVLLAAGTLVSGCALLGDHSADVARVNAFPGSAG